MMWQLLQCTALVACVALVLGQDCPPVSVEPVNGQVQKDKAPATASDLANLASGKKVLFAADQPLTYSFDLSPRPIFLLYLRVALKFVSWVELECFSGASSVFKEMKSQENGDFNRITQWFNVNFDINVDSVTSCALTMFSVPGEIGINQLELGACCIQDPQWGPWRRWDTCSKTCGGGTQGRTRTCEENPDCPGGTCPGDSSQTRRCNDDCCPDAEWSDWGRWDTCSVTCGDGTQGRTRTCESTCPGGTCPGDSSQNRNCNDGCCREDGNWSDWTDWSTCTVSCDGGTRERYRSCNDPAPACGGDICSGAGEEIQNCNTMICPCENDDKEVWNNPDQPFTATIDGNDASAVFTNQGQKMANKQRLLIVFDFLIELLSFEMLAKDVNSIVLRAYDEGDTLLHQVEEPSGGQPETEVIFTMPPGGVKGVKYIELQFKSTGSEWKVSASGSEVCQRDPYCVWGDWAEWTTCSKTCGLGRQDTSRNCECPANAPDQVCAGPDEKKRDCSPAACAP